MKLFVHINLFVQEVVWLRSGPHNTLSWSRGPFTTAPDRIVLYCIVLQRIAVLQSRTFLG